mmetsp:Transcript_21369/g.52344  ORF Transcript_21369/g.52344 Transcript_21369/m.52344 type:complete len:224 (-) Transcript_21369:227-898(-)
MLQVQQAVHTLGGRHELLEELQVVLVIERPSDTLTRAYLGPPSRALSGAISRFGFGGNLLRGSFLCQRRAFLDYDGRWRLLGFRSGVVRFGQLRSRFCLLICRSWGEGAPAQKLQEFSVDGGPSRFLVLHPRPDATDDPPDPPFLLRALDLDELRRDRRVFPCHGSVVYHPPPPAPFQGRRHSPQRRARPHRPQISRPLRGGARTLLEAGTALQHAEQQGEAN